MKFTKLSITLTSIILILSLMTPVYGTVVDRNTITNSGTSPQAVSSTVDEEKMDEAKISKEEAKTIAKKALLDYFDYEIDEKLFESSIEFREDYRTSDKFIWHIRWYYYNRERSTNISVSLNSDNGKITSIGKHEYNHSVNRPTIPQITEDEAKIIGETFMKQVFPEKYEEVQLTDSLYPNNYPDTTYRFTYARFINDIKYDADSITVEVDGINGTVNSIYCNWDDNVEVPSKENIIDKDTALKTLQDNIDMELNYIPNRSVYYDYHDNSNQVKLIYTPNIQNDFILDAKQNVLMNTMGEIIEEKVSKDISNEKKEVIYQQADYIKELETEISEGRAREVITSFIKELYGEDYEIKSLRYMENDNYWETNGQKYWSAQFTRNDNESLDNNGSIAINALTEQLIYAYFYNHYGMMMQEENYDPEITWEEGYDKAIEAIEEYFPDKIMDIDTELEYVKHDVYHNGKLLPEYDYYYRFYRNVNSIIFNEDSIIISIDSKNGSIKEIRARWSDDVDFPKPTNIISKEDAEVIYFEKYVPELVYTRINKNKDYKNPEWEIKLVYRLTAAYNTGQYIDAFTGKFLSYSGEEITETNNEFKELIKDHKAEKELSILASKGILNVEGFEFDKEVTRMDAIKMLVTAKGYRPYMAKQADSLKYTNVTKDNEDYNYLLMAVVYGIIDNKEEPFKFDEKITNEEAAEMLVRLLGYHKVANIKGIFKAQCKDAYNISKERVGHVAICLGLDIMETNGFNVFKPKSNITLADMSVAIYNALGNIRKN